MFGLRQNKRPKIQVLSRFLKHLLKILFGFTPILNKTVIFSLLTFYINQTMKKYNFFAGPATLPQTVINQTGEAIANFADMGLSILEISHRSAEFTAVMEEAEQQVRDLLGLSDDFAVLFLTGGASSQFYMSAMNLLQKKAAYLDTGTWSKKCIKEAKAFGEIEVVASSGDKNYNYIPKGYEVPTDAEYLHITSNNTIFGTQIHDFPDVSMPLICDASSDIFSRPLDLSKFGMIYAGAQKNMGPAGTTLVIIRKDLLGKVERKIPTMLNYQTHIDKNSSFNTPPVLPIYVSMLVFRWLKDQGGVAQMEIKNQQKAELLYNAIDDSPQFYGSAAEEDRSLMNVTFNIKDETKQEAFLKLASENGCVGLKGHRSVGGFRASIYNAMALEGIEKLVSVIHEFDRLHA